MKPFSMRVCVLVIACIAGLAICRADELAAVTGLVTDPNGRSVPGVTVIITNLATNVASRTVTNDQGIYRVPSLQPGIYRITVDKDGFKSIVKSGVELHVQDVASINFELQIGSVNETVTVEGGAPLVNTESAAVSTVVDRQFVENIPLNGRTLQTLIMLTPGVNLVPNEPGQFSVNGQRTTGNYLTVDGASANIGASTNRLMTGSVGGQIPAFNILGGTNSLVSVDALQEFRIQTSSFAPEFGRTPGGQISIVTRSGTNQFHGTLFDYLRNDVFDANNWFAAHNNQPKPKDRQNDFGGVVGGPLLRDRTFFFVSYEGLRLRQPLTSVTVVPSTASANPALNRQSAPAAMQPFLNAYPVPNGQDLGNGFAQFNASYSNPVSLDAYSIRVDQVLTPRLTLFARYNYSPSETRARSAMLSDIQQLKITTHTLTLGSTQVLSSSVNNELRVNYSNVRGGGDTVLDNFGGASPLFDATVFPAGFSSANSSFLLQIFGATGFVTLGNVGVTEQRQLNFVDNVSLVRGSHQLKFGVDYRWLAPIVSPQSYSQSALFSGMTGPTGALAGTALSATDSATLPQALLQKNFSLYTQDTWRIMPRLTVTYGLRWDVNPALSGKRSADDPIAVQGVNDLATLAPAPFGTPLFSTTWGNVAPRIGVAYQVRKREGWGTVARGGLGVFYDLGTMGIFAGAVWPFIAIKSLGSVPFPLTAKQAAPPVITRNLPVAGLFVAVDPNLELPRTYQWNVALEQSLGKDQAISATYVGAVGRRLLRQDSLLAPNSNFTSQVFVTKNAGASDYHGLQLQIQRRLAHGLQGLASYTWSHSLDNASTDNESFGGFAPAIFSSNKNLDRGDSTFDVRHSFSAAVTYDIPVLRQQLALRTLVGDWSIEALIIARSALPVDITGSSTVLANGFAFSARPNAVSGIPLYLFGPQFPGGKALNNTPNQGGPGCKGPYCPAAAGQQGNLRRDSLRGFGAWQTNFALQRRFHLRGPASLQFRAEFFNLFNHPTFGSPMNFFTSPLFGQSTSTLADSLGSGGASGTLNPLYQVGGPRSIQLALKLQF